MDAPLLTTKLYTPPVRTRERVVSRPRLIRRLNEGFREGAHFSRKLTPLSAPAGFGKTTLLSEWIANCGCPVAWLSLDEGDDDPARFMNYLIAALRKVDRAVQIGQQALDALRSPGQPMQTVLSLLTNEIAAAPEPFILVLDDYHAIRSPSIHKALVFLIDHLPPQMHLVLATRVDPPWPIARLRGRGQLAELRLADLRFTQAEAVEFLSCVLGLELKADDIATLNSRTEGWIAGLQMAALALQGSQSALGGRDARDFIRAFSGSDRYILDYLVEEVLQGQPEQIQTFLLYTSILDRLSGPLCDAVLGREAESSEKGREQTGRETLDYLERANLFVLPLDNRREWYRYHRLFADLLRVRLERLYPERVPELHRRASAWCERHGLLDAAVDHALAAGDGERAADLVELIAEATLLRGELSTFLRWVEALPDRTVRARPTLCALYAWMLLWQGRSLKMIESLLQDAAKGNERIAAGRVTALRGLMAGFRGQVSLANELSHRALEQLPEEEQFVRTFATWLLHTSQLSDGECPKGSRAFDDMLRMSQEVGNLMLSVMVLCNQAELLMREGRLHQAAETYRQALEMATDMQGHRLAIAGQAMIGLGELSREWNDLDAAERYLLEGIQLTEQWSEVGPLEAYLALARVLWARGDRDAAWGALRKAEELAVKFDLTDLDDLSVAMFQARMWVAQGELELTGRWAGERDLYQYIDSPLRERPGDSYDHRMLKYELLVLARLLIAQDRPGDALTVLETLVPIAEWRGRPGMLIEIYALQALALDAQEDLDRALIALERALSLAEPQGYVRIFVDEGEPMARLLYQAAVRGIAPAYVGKLLVAFPTSGPAPLPSMASEQVVEPLSERELEVLRYIAKGLSNREIARRLVLSTNTVKSHARQIYEKLDVHSRTQAVAKARTLRILPPG